MLPPRRRMQATNSMDLPSVSSSLQEATLLGASLVVHSTQPLLWALMFQVQVLALAGASHTQDMSSLVPLWLLLSSASSVLTSLEARPSIHLEPSLSASSLEHSTLCSPLA